MEHNKDERHVVEGDSPPSLGSELMPEPRGLRVTDPETARVVAIHAPDERIVGAGCIVTRDEILTCRHVVEEALNPDPIVQDKLILVSLVGVDGQPAVRARVENFWVGPPSRDLALLRIVQGPEISIEPVEFASALRHGGKSYSVLGFPGGDLQGRNASGRLQGADAMGLLQMDRGGALSILGGFSGAPVWSTDLSAFIGLVVREQSGSNVSWCIPSRILCAFHPTLRVRFRIPPADRPRIHDRSEDDPNKYLFGEIAAKGNRRLTATVSRKAGDFTVHVTYECPGPPQGHFVTFITYPDFEEEGEDAYELFGELVPSNGDSRWIAEQEFYPGGLFTVAVIAHGGDTVLTCDLEQVYEQVKREKRQKKKKRKEPTRKKD
jgi:Trypsin-like peptidase domain